MPIKLVDNDSELHQILAIQRENHFTKLSASNKKDKGFVNVLHNFNMLSKMNTKAPQIIATDKNNVAGYALVMFKEFNNLIPSLVPMFETFEKISFHQQKLSNLNYYVMGQICIQDNYKRKGLFKKLYQKHKEVYANKFDYCITEVSSSNIPSMEAHKKVGFKTIHTFKDSMDQWNIMLWDWK